MKSIGNQLKGSGLLAGRLGCLLGVALLFAEVQGAQLPGLVPSTPQPLKDRQGNEWLMDSNGMLSRPGSGNSLLSGAMMLMVGSEQFYCAQAMGTQDGKEVVLVGQQPMQGLQVTRYVRFLEKEGGLRYLELFANTSTREVTAVIELRHNFSGQVKSVLSDAARAINGVMEKNETGAAVVPGSPGHNGFAFVGCGPRSGVQPRVVAQNLYQLSFFYTLVVPPGQSAGILHTITQGGVTSKPDSVELEKLFRPMALARQVRDLPKGTAPLVVNLRPAGNGVTDLAAWMPAAILGIDREAVDVLAMGEGTRLRGRATCARLSLQHRIGTFNLPWEKVVALVGGRQDGGLDRVYLADGQILRGRIQAEELKFTLSSGLQMTLQPAELDRLVLAAPPGPVSWPPGIAALLETWGGERWAVPESEIAALTFQLTSSWGSRSLPWGELSLLAREEGEAGPPLAVCRDGSRLRVWLGAQETLTFTSPGTVSQTLPGTQVRALAASFAFPPASGERSPAEEIPEEPVTAFAELAGEQRLVAPASDSAWQLVTTGGVVTLDPSAIREMRNVSEDAPAAGSDESPWFQLELWGGGTVLGQMQPSTLGFAVGGEVWRIPAQEVVRFVNPVPKLAEATLARIGELVRELGDEKWQTRERAAGELQTLGDLARSSLRDALRHAEDVEVKRRLEQLLGGMD